MEDKPVEEDLNGRQPQWKKISMEDDLNRMKCQWRATSMEDNLKEALQEDDIFLII